MLEIHRLEETDLPELEPFRTMRRRKDMDRLNQFVAEDRKIVRRLFDSRFAYRIISLLVTDECLEEFRIELELIPEPVIAYIADKPTIERISGFHCKEGIKVMAQILEPHTIDGVLDSVAKPQLLIGCDGLTNAENMGAIVRNGAAFGADAVVVSEDSTSPYLTRTIRASMGTLFELPCVQPENFFNTLRDLKWRGFTLVGAHPHTDQCSLANADLNRDCVLIFGSEGHGISERIRKLCDELVVIPMSGKVDSLNVGSSVAVFLYEAARQRGRM